MDRELKQATKDYWTAIVKLAEQGNKEAIKVCKKASSRLLMARLGVKRPKIR